MDKIKNILRTVLVTGLMVISAGTYAQQKMTVSGTVKDSKGEPVIGAAVLLDGTTTGVVTDIDGKYSISFTSKSGVSPKLNFSSMSYITEVVEVKNRSVIDVTLKEDTEQLEEVVVVGYGAVRRSDLTGAVTSVKIDETQASQSSSLDQLLQGHAAGVQVVSNSSAPDAGITVTIRGANSFSLNTEPLYVVDGIIMNIGTDATVSSRAGKDAGMDEPTNGLMGIDPQDIASMEVLKDASATAIYGSQGANGVILITTKSAKREKPVVTFSAGMDISTIYKKFDLFSTDNFTDFLRACGYDEESQYWTPFTEGLAKGVYSPVDWQDYTTRVAISQRYYMSIAGRPKDTNYRFSVSYNDNQGVIKGTGYQKLTTRLNLDKTLGKFSIGTKTGVSLLKSSLTQGAGSGRQTAATSMIYSMLTTRPLMWLPDYDEEGLEYDDDRSPSGPERWLTDFENTRNEIRVTPSIYAQYKILPWLSFKSTFGGDFRVTEQNKFKSQRISTTTEKSTGGTTHTERMSWNWDNLLQVNKKLGKHNINATLGQSASAASIRIESEEGTNIEQWKTMTDALNSAPYAYLTYTESYSQLMSFFARAVYSYADRYVLTATYRFDGSSKFAGANKWAQFPSLAFAWRLNQEPWFKVPFISSAKVRLGWGKVGNQGVPTYQTIYRYGTGRIPSHDSETGKQLIVSSSNLPSYDLKWETTTQYNVGIDLGLWKGRFSVEADWYRKQTDDLLQTMTLASSAGVSDPYVNMGSILNTGVELTVNATPVLTRDFEWNLGGNIAWNRNKILSINPTGLNSDYLYIYRDEPQQFVEYFTGSALSGSGVCTDYVNIFIAGQPMGLFYGYATDGLYQEGEEGLPGPGGIAARGAGSVKYIDVNGDGQITENDRCIIGDPNPDFTYGFNTSLRYKRLTLTADFIGSQGNDIYNQMAMTLTHLGDPTKNHLTACVYDAWSETNTTGKYPKISTYNIADVASCSDRFVEDGSYLRMANVSLSYDIPFKNKNFFIKGLNVGVTGKNLCVWTKFSGYDPDVNTYGTASKRGVDGGAYPSTRSFLLDVKFTF